MPRARTAGRRVRTGIAAHARSKPVIDAGSSSSTWGLAVPVLAVIGGQALVYRAWRDRAEAPRQGGGGA